MIGYALAMIRCPNAIFYLATAATAGVAGSATVFAATSAGVITLPLTVQTVGVEGVPTNFPGSSTGVVLKNNDEKPIVASPGLGGTAVK